MSAPAQTQKSRAEAQAAAGELFEMVKWAAGEWVVAGSVRRQLDRVNDIDHVIETRPKLLEVIDRLTAESGSLFGNQGQPFEKALNARGTPKSWGDKRRAIKFRGFVHELYFVRREAFGRQLAIRTGPAEFSKALVIRENDLGLARDGGALVNPKTGEVIETVSERAYFEAIQWPYTEPHKRG